MEFIEILKKIEPWLQSSIPIQPLTTKAYWEQDFEPNPGPVNVLLLSSLFLSLGHVPRLDDLQYGMDMRNIQRLLIFTSYGPSASYRMLDLLDLLATFRVTFKYPG